MNNQNYIDKYLKYKQKYFKLQNQLGGVQCLKYGFIQHKGECIYDSFITIMLLSDDIGDYIQYIINDKFINSVNLDDSIDCFIRESRKYNFLLPINIEITDLELFYSISKEYLINVINRFKNKQEQNYGLPPYNFRLQREISQDCSIYSVINSLRLYNINNYSQKNPNYDYHSGNYMSVYINIQLFNYYFQNNNTFINTHTFNRHNIHLLTNDLLCVTSGINTSISRMDLQSCRYDNHSTAYYKCDNTYYYYDDNGLKGDSVFIQYDWFLILSEYINGNKEINLFDILEADIKKNIKRYNPNKKYILKYLNFYYIDTFKNEDDYYHKLLLNFNYYTLFNNPRANKKLLLNEDYIIKNIELYPSIIGYIEYSGLPLTFNKQFMLKAVSIEGMSIKYDRTHNPDIIINAIKNNQLSYNLVDFRIISPGAKNKIILELIELVIKNNCNFKLFKILHYDFNAVRTIVSNNGLLLEFARRFNDNYEIVERAVEQNMLAIKYASERLQSIFFL